jgi:hypothetical protein
MNVQLPDLKGVIRCCGDHSRRAGTLEPDERATLERLTQEADLRTLRKAYAAVLLKWRGHRLPGLTELSA